MTTQKITVKIPRKKSELIPFDLEKWNTGEYEAVSKYVGVGRVLCTDNGGDYPVVVAYGKGSLSTYTINGIFSNADSPSIFLRKKSEYELLKDDFLNVYTKNYSFLHRSLEGANHVPTHNRIALLHITYTWED